MNTNEKKKINLDKQTLKMIFAGFVCFAGVLLFSDFAGVFRTLPFLVLCGALCEIFFKVSLLFCASCTFVMNLFMCFVNQRNMSTSLSLSLFSVLLVICGMYVGKIIVILKNTDKKSLKKRCIRYAFTVIFASFVLNFFVSGNPVSFLVSSKSNTQYLEHNYEKDVQKKYTLYSPVDFEYRTYIEFMDGENVVGRDNETYVCVKDKNIKDGYRDYYEEKMLFYASRQMSSDIAQATDAFEISACDIVFEDGEILKKDSDFKDYSDRVGYVVSFYSILDDEKDFLSLAKDCVLALSKSETEFSEVVLCAGNANKVLYSAVVNFGMQPSELDGIDLSFDEKAVRKYGVTEKTILDYWLNL